MTRHRTELTNAMILQYLRDGRTSRSIAREYGLSEPAINSRLKGMNTSATKLRATWGIIRGVSVDLADQIETTYRQGGTHHATAKTLGLRISTVDRVLALRQISPNSKAWFDDDQKAEMARRYKAGKSCQQIANDYGVTEKTVRRSLADLEVPRRALGRPSRG